MGLRNVRPGRWCASFVIGTTSCATESSVRRLARLRGRVTSPMGPSISLRASRFGHVAEPLAPRAALDPAPRNRTPTESIETLASLIAVRKTADRPANSGRDIPRARTLARLGGIAGRSFRSAAKRYMFLRRTIRAFSDFDPARSSAKTDLIMARIHGRGFRRLTRRRIMLGRAFGKIRVPA